MAANGVGGTDAKTPGGELSCAAFRNPDGEMVVVLANQGAETRAQLVFGSYALEVAVEADSVHTIKWT